MRLAESTWTDARDADTDLALLPVGSTEQHGPHAPLGVDSTTAAAIADAGADRYADSTGERPVVAPTIPVGIAEEHRGFEGTLWVSPDTFRSYVRETLESLAASGFDRIVVVNGHGGNTDAIRELCARASRSGDAYAVGYTWFDAVDFDAFGHAGPAETAVIRHLDPGSVREGRLDAAAAGAAEGWGEWIAGTNLAHDSDSFTDNGVVGDPRDGDADLGAELLAAAADRLAELLAAVATRELDADAGSDSDR
ncbi:creatininase domain protein [Natronomonas moolapensis 8.8.11]|uniref:Creatininase domain protein n=1 Tax=Natronomonas moolapensis (strain DSM 18674 / CECT 7526 / JCM 14361 / 8.8.11) TaxID=268739 RepID=M1XNJ6_NATM8|nr:creatininase family protein [Natronomonas moolapensis]CCQ35505.1 creatininase domain protein [Natronomonas moolapensis 8.8.11]